MDKLLQISRQISSKRIYCFLFAALTISILFGNGIIGHIKNFDNRYIFNDDARQQIVPFFSCYDKGYKPGYTDEYYLNVFVPGFYKFIYKNWSKHYDPRILSRIIEYVNIILLTLFVYLLLKRYSDFYTAVAGVVLIFSLDYLFSRAAGGLPRSFAYTIFTSGLYFLLQRKLKHVGLVIIIGAGFYPMASFLMLGLFAFNIIFYDIIKDRVHNRKILLKHLVILLIASFFSFLIIYPNIVNSKKYGDKISFEDSVDFPESLLGGRYGPSDYIKKDFVDSLLSDHKLQLIYNFYTSSDIRSFSYDIQFRYSVRLWFYLFFLGMVIWHLSTGSIKAPFFKDIVLIYIQVIITYSVAFLLYPNLFIPSRYIAYSVPVLILWLLPLGLKAILESKGIKYQDSGFCVFIVFALFSVLFVGGFSNNTGYSIDESRNKGIYEFIDKLQNEGGLIAGWPAGITDNVPYINKRNVYYNYEPHQALHKKYTLHMRRVAKKFFNAYFATDMAELKKFANEENVRFMIVEKYVFTSYDNARYFEPFNKYIKDRFIESERTKKGFILPELESKAIYKDAEYFILDLKGI